MAKTKKELILYDLKKGITYSKFKEKFELTKTQAKAYIKKLKKEGYCISERSVRGDVHYFLDNFVTPTAAIDLDEVDSDFSFGLVSDTHLCCKECHLTDLLDFYDKIHDRGIKHVNHIGDLTDGIGVYQGQANSLTHHTLDAQIAHVVNAYPFKKEVTTHFITGNHDLKVLSKVGIDIGNVITSRRPDLHYLGQVSAVINLAGIKLELCHYKGSMAWSRGYRLQKYIRDYQGRQPDILALGHKHVMEFARIQNTYGFECGGWQGANNFTKERGLSAVIGGWIVRIVQVDGVIKKIIPEWVEY